jgi:hypothetical protein
MPEGYHYTRCGLDYVYLLNGYEVRETAHGRGLAIEDGDDLHDRPLHRHLARQAEGTSSIIDCWPTHTITLIFL